MGPDGRGRAGRRRACYNREVRARRLLIALPVAAVLGMAIFGVLASRAVDVEEVPLSEAGQRFERIRAALGGREPLLHLDASGNVVRRAAVPDAAARPVNRLGVLAFQAGDERLVTADVPLWFFKLKGPAAQYLVRGTGLDLERLEITASDLERYGPSIVVDHTRASGDRLLVWTE